MGKQQQQEALKVEVPGKQQRKQQQEQQQRQACKQEALRKKRQQAQRDEAQRRQEQAPRQEVLHKQQQAFKKETFSGSISVPVAPDVLTSNPIEKPSINWGRPVSKQNSLQRLVPSPARLHIAQCATSDSLQWQEDLRLRSPQKRPRHMVVEQSMKRRKL